MKYPKLLNKGDTIGICAPSSGVSGETLNNRLDTALKNINSLGYKTIETPSVRFDDKCVSTDSKTRAKEFMSLYENPDVTAIIPPWGGEFLMDMLSYLDFEKLAALPAKWVSGYSDISTLTFVLTVNSNIATIHGSNSMNMGYLNIHDSDKRVFEVMSSTKTKQHSWDSYGGYSSWDDFSKDIYILDKPSLWKSLQKETKTTFSGMMIGGCMDTLCKLIGTRFAPVEGFLKKHKQHGFIWTLESCEMSASDLYRTFWQMNENGWFKYCDGILFGRPDGYKDNDNFTLIDALEQGLGKLKIPVIYDADIGHIPPQMQIVNGAFGKVIFDNGKAVVFQELSC